MASFSTTAAIAEFLADADRISLELPHMTSGQRKSTKKLLENYPELRCESYGFGADRQLHLFKKAPEKEEDAGELAKCCGTSAYPQNVKGNFVDDWAASDLKVRNTFIHFPDANPDQRVVQSMPHGMFRQCMSAEHPHDECGYDTPTTMGCETPTAGSETDAELTHTSDGHQGGQCWPLSLGALVVVEGLVKVPAFNGRSAVVQGWDDATERWNILLVSQDGCQQAKIKEENLRVILPCP